MELPTIGQRIRYTTKTARRGWLEAVSGEGVVICIWDNGWDGAHLDIDDGRCVIPSLGDTWQAAQGPEEQ